MKAAMYTTHAKAYAEAVKDNLFNALYERPSTQALLGELNGKQVLDLGCGSGEYIDYLLKAGARVRAVDLSAQMVELVEQRFGQQVQVYQQDLSQGLPEEQDASAEVIICPLVLHYLQDLSAFFSEVKRVLAPGGYMVFSTHHPFVDLLDFHGEPDYNYFRDEWIEEEWETIGKPVKVGFYRRSLESIISGLTASGLVVSGLSEGRPSEAMRERDPQRYQQLSTRPQFVFVRCQHA